MRRDAEKESGDLLAAAREQDETARARAEQVLHDARAEAEQMLAKAAEQTAWTQQTMDSVLAAAELESQRIREAGHADAAAHLRDVRRDVEGVLAPAPRADGRPPRRRPTPRPRS